MAGKKGRSGRRPATNKQKRAKGETRPSRQTEVTNIVAFPKVRVLPDPPAWMNKHGCEFWKTIGAQLIAQRILTTADLRAFAQLCQLDGRLIDKAERGIEPTASEIAQHRMYMAEFGITPSSRVRVGLPHGGKTQNPFEKNRQEDAEGAPAQAD